MYLECHMGAAGDMLTAALLELIPEPDAFVEKMNGLGIPGVHFEIEPAEKCGITGTHVTVTVHGEEEESHDVHMHEHHHEHEHTTAMIAEHDHDHHHAHDHSHHQHA